MPTYARKHQLTDSLVYHIYNRSSNRVPIFQSVDDYHRFKILLRAYSVRFLIKIYHWAIMQNHFHLLIEIENPEKISKVMAGLNRAYTHYYHGKYITAGHLWQGRFKAQAVQKKDYMVACGRYIERNPVKAGIASNAWDYLHSSAQFYCLGIDDGITCEDPTYQEFSRNKEDRKTEYKKFLRDFDAEQEKQFDTMENSVGSLEFMRKLVVENGRIIPRRRGKPRSINHINI